MELNEKARTIMKIKFKNKRLYPNLVLGLVFIGLGVFVIVEDQKFRWSDYGYILIGMLYIGYYLYNATQQYLTIENGTIQKNGLFGFRNKINLNDIEWIKKLAGNYFLKTETKTLEIDTNLIEENSLKELNNLLKKLNLPADKTPFARKI